MSTFPKAFADAPAQREHVRVCVTIPARDEAGTIAQALTALTAQRSLDGSPLDPRLFEILVLANNCSDATAARARAHAARSLVPILVDEVRFAEPDAHIGHARKAVMDAAAQRFACAGRDGFIASTDADSVVHPQWIARTIEAMHDADAVTGRIVMDPVWLNGLGNADRAMLALESSYQYAVCELASLTAPLAHDPWPRHWQHFGASFAVRASIYTTAGGIPPVPLLEDVALYHALTEAGVRVRHSIRVRVTTSGRLAARVSGGLARYLGDLHALAERGAPLLVEHPFSTRERLAGELCVVRPQIAMEAALTGLRDQIARVRVMTAFATRSNAASGAG